MLAGSVGFLLASYAVGKPPAVQAVLTNQNAPRCSGLLRETGLGQAGVGLQGAAVSILGAWA